MHTGLNDPYTVIVAATAVIGSAYWLGYRLGIWRSSQRISKRLKTDREFGIAILEDLALRWGVKVEHTETPAGGT